MSAWFQKRIHLWYLLCGATLVWPLSSAGAPAEARPAYAVVSLVGDKLMLTGYNPGVGSNIDQNSRREIDVSSDELDRAALFAAERAVQETKPGAQVVLLSVRDARLLSEQEKLSGTTAESKAFIEYLKTLLHDQAPARVLVLSKFRGDTSFQLSDGHIGTGKIRGVGFYIDRVSQLTLTNSGASGAGFLAPFAYIKATLVDLESLSVLGDASATASVVLPTALSKDAVHPWDVLSSADKFKRLQSLIREAVSKAVPEALGNS